MISTIVHLASPTLTAQQIADLALHQDQVRRRAERVGDIETARSAERERDRLILAYRL